MDFFWETAALCRHMHSVSSDNRPGQIGKKKECCDTKGKNREKLYTNCFYFLFRMPYSARKSQSFTNQNYNYNKELAH